MKKKSSAEHLYLSVLCFAISVHFESQHASKAHIAMKPHYLVRSSARATQVLAQTHLLTQVCMHLSFVSIFFYVAID